MEGSFLRKTFLQYTSINLNMRISTPYIPQKTMEPLLCKPTSSKGNSNLNVYLNVYHCEHHNCHLPP